MDLIEERARYEAFQNKMLDQIQVCIRDNLRAAGINDQEALSQTTWNMTFDIACMIDGSTHMEVDGNSVFPILTFATTPKYQELLHHAGGSWLHESIDEDAVDRLCTEA